MVRATGDFPAYPGLCGLASHILEAVPRACAPESRTVRRLPPGGLYKYTRSQFGSLVLFSSGGLKTAITLTDLRGLSAGHSKRGTGKAKSDDRSRVSAQSAVAFSGSS